MAKRLIQKAHNRDGLPEILVGLNLLLVSGLIYAHIELPRGSTGSKAAIVAFAFMLPLLTFTSPAILRWLRRRYLVGRVGYVQHNPTGRKQIAFGIMLALAMTVTLFGIVPRLSEPDRWLLAGTGLLGGALMALCGRSLRFTIGGILTAAAGAVVAFSGVSLEVGFTVLFGFQGLLTLISGAVVFLRFIRQPIEPVE